MSLMTEYGARAEDVGEILVRVCCPHMHIQHFNFPDPRTDCSKS